VGTKLITTKNLAAYAGRLLPSVDVNGALVAAHDTDPEREGFIPARLSDPALKAAFASRYASAATAAAVGRMLAKLRRGAEDVTVLMIGDSTGNAADEHFYLEAQGLAAQFPGYTAQLQLWNDTTGAYGGISALQTGTGTRTLRFYNLSVSGVNTGYALGSRWAAGVAALGEVDCIFISHGHNEPDPGTGENSALGVAARNQYLALTEELAAQFPRAGIVFQAQNPRLVSGEETRQAVRAQIIQRIAAQRGYGFIDVHQAFIDYGNFAPLLDVDSIHPITGGSQLWAQTVLASITYDKQAASGPTRLASALTEAAPAVLPADLFDVWNGPVPAGWTLTNATTAKDATNFETGSFGLQVTAGAGAGAAYAEYAVTPASLGIQSRISGQWVTVAARVFVPASYAGTPALVLQDQGGSGTQAASFARSATRGRFFWLIASKRITAPASALKVQLAARLSGSEAGSITVDRLYVVEGDLPRYPVRRHWPRPMFDHLSTAGAGVSPVVTGLMLQQGAWTNTAANDAVYTRVVPHRDILVTKLVLQFGTASGNFDVGIADAAGNRLWSSGSTAVAAVHTVTVGTPVLLRAGVTYYFVIAVDNTTATVRGLSLGSSAVPVDTSGAVIAYRAPSAFPIPASSPVALGGAASGSLKVPAITARDD
jgi:hypothetical protein